MIGMMVVFRRFFEEKRVNACFVREKLDHAQG